MTEKSDKPDDAFLRLIDRIHDDVRFADNLERLSKSADTFSKALSVTGFEPEGLTDSHLNLAQEYLVLRLKKRDARTVMDLIDDIRKNGEFAKALANELEKTGDLRTILAKYQFFMDEKETKIIAAFLEARNSDWAKRRTLAFETMEKTLKHAVETYSDIGTMSKLIFGLGVFLFVVAAISSLVNNQPVYSLAFAGLGAADFVALFLYKPMEKRQQALSDLVQAEIIYMNYTQQDHIFNMMCMTKRTLSNYDEGLLKEASELLQKRAAENVELCQNFLEPCEAAAAPQPPGTPEGLSATPGNGQVTLEWKAPASNGGSLITGYRVYRGIISGVATLVAPLGRDLTYNDGGLENGKRYYYKTSAVNSVGEGPQSKEVTAVPGTPPAPTIRYVKPEDGKATLVWKAPTSDGGSKIIGYNVYRGETRDTVELVKAYETPETSHTDSDLTNGQTYYYKVSAVNSSGEGPQSETISTVPHPASAGGAQA